MLKDKPLTLNDGSVQPQDFDTPCSTEEVKDMNFVREVTSAAQSYESAATEVIDHISAEIEAAQSYI